MKKGLLYGVGLALPLVLSVFSIVPTFVAGQTAGDIPPELQPIAQELGCTTKLECEKAFNADFERGLELAEKYNVYTSTERELAQSFKQEVLIKLQTVKEEEFDETVVRLASEILRSKPALARQLNVTRSEVRAAETIVNEVKNAGVSLSFCSKPANTLSNEQLEGCLAATKRLATQSDAVKIYISKEKLGQADLSTRALQLQGAISRGEYRDLGGTADEIGTVCLRPNSPVVCDEIAVRFFGPEGVKELERARSRVSEVEQYYRKGVDTILFTLPDGRVLVGKESIGNACEQAFTRRDVTLARACGEFAVKNGFASPKEVEEGISLIQSFAEKGAGVNFEDCRLNPQACEQYLPEQKRGEFAVFRQIEEIMRAEIGFNPQECEAGGFNPDIGKKCFEGAKRALPKLEALSTTFPPARAIIEEIRGHIAEGERYAGKQQQFEQVFQGGGGPGGCRTPEECYAYCSDSSHGAECISFGAKHEVFRGDEAVRRYEQYSQKIIVGPPIVFPGGPGGTSSFPGVGPYPGFQPPPFGSYPPGQTPGFTEPGPGFYTPPPGYGGGPGPSPECFAAIQTGDFVKAKQVCYIPPSIYPLPSACPQYSPSQPCGEGYYRQDRRDEKGCYLPGECVAIPDYRRPPITQPGPLPGVTEEQCRTKINEGYQWDSRYGCYRPVACPAVVYPECQPGYYRPEVRPWECPSLQCVPKVGICPALPTVDSCPSGQHKVVTYSSPDCGTYYACEPDSGTPPPTGQREQIWNSLGLRSWVRSDADPARITELKAACANTPSGSNIWLPGSGDYSSRDFGMPDPNKCRAVASCTTDQYWNGTSCVTSGGQTCPGGQYWYQPPGSTSGYCKSTSETQCDWTTQYLKTSNNTCQPKSNCTDPTNSEYNTIECQGIRSGTGYSTSTYSGSCTSELISLLGSGCHTMGNAWFNGGMTSYVWPGTTAVKNCSSDYIANCTSGGTQTCPSGQYWNGTACVSSTGGCSSYNSQTSCVGASEKCDWRTSGSTGWCQPSTATASCGNYICESGETTSCPTDCPAYTPPSCPSGQYWYVPPGGGSGYCKASEGQACPSGQYWNGSTCVSSSGSTCPSFAHDMGGYCMLNNDTSKCAEYSNASSESNYNSAACTARTQTQSCPSGQYWSGTACLTSTTTTTTTTTTTCPSGQYWNGTSCVTSTTTTCPSGQYWYVPPGSTAGSCVSSTTTTCPSGQYWSGTSCVSSTTTTCPSDQYWNGTACVSSTTTTCPSGQYWSGTACVTSSPTPTTDPATACTQSGGTWNGTTCQSTPPPGAFLNPQHLLAQLATLVNNFAKIFQILYER